MTREIKFRAWSTSVKRMFLDNGQILDVLSQRSYLLQSKQEDCWPDLVFMQYTGLNDKNGVEIYEGDIVATNPNIEESGNYIIKHINDEHWNCFVLTYTNEEYYLCSLTDGEVSALDIKVIGNIYENPELIEVKE
jgi:uncharacterized phage protein (TIGR01671 family)